MFEKQMNKRYWHVKEWKWKLWDRMLAEWKWCHWNLESNWLFLEMDRVLSATGSVSSGPRDGGKNHFIWNKQINISQQSKAIIMIK